MNRLLIIRFSSLGDIILTEPIVCALRTAYPDGELHFLTKQRFHGVPILMRGIASVHKYDPEWRGQLLAELKRLKFDAVIDLHNNVRSRLVCETLGLKSHRANKQWLRRMAAVKFKKLLSQPQHAVERFAAALKPLGIGLVSRSPSLFVPPMAEEWWSQERSKYPVGADYYVIAAGAAHATKMAPVELWQRLHAKLSERGFAGCIIVGSESEREVLERVSASTGGTPVITERSIVNAAAIVKSAQFVLSNDSGLAHLAAGLGVPVLALFGPTHPILGFSPLGDYANSYTVDERCSPCSLHGSRECYREERFCFSRMDADTIVAKVEELIAERGQRGGATSQ